MNNLDIAKKVNLQHIEDIAKKLVADLWARGGEGAIELAQKVVEVVKTNPPIFDPMYDWNWDVKTQKSLSDNPTLLGRPKDFIITVCEINYIYPNENNPERNIH